MKPKITLRLLIPLTPFFLFGQTYTQFFDGADTSASNSLFINIDTSANNIWQIGRPQKSVFHSASTAPNAIVTDTADFYPVNNTSSFTIDIDPSVYGWGILALQWMQKLDMSYGFDGGMVEYSVDSGNTWSNVFNDPYVYNIYGFDPANMDTLPNGKIGFTGSDEQWKNVWLCFDMYWLSYYDLLSFRFTLLSDSIDGGNEGWLMDNFLGHITQVHTISEKKPDEYMAIAPNPTPGRVNIEAQKLAEFHIIEKIELLSFEGQILQEWGISPTKFYIDLDPSLPNGTYVLKVKTNVKTQVFKVILER